MKLTEVAMPASPEHTGWYIIGPEDTRASSGPYATRQEAARASLGKQWFDERKFGFEYGFEDENDQFHDQPVPNEPT
jgi:hypothetical protein